MNLYDWYLIGFSATRGVAFDFETPSKTEERCAFAIGVNAGSDKNNLCLYDRERVEQLVKNYTR